MLLRFLSHKKTIGEKEKSDFLSLNKIKIKIKIIFLKISHKKYQFLLVP